MNELHHYSKLEVYGSLSAKDETHANTNIKMYHCERCDHKTKHKWAFIRHWSRKHDHRAKLSIKRNDRGNAKVYKCKFCNFASKLNTNLTKHIKYKHDPNAEVFRCNRCSFATKIKSHHTKHVKEKHDVNATVFTCDRCNYKTKDKFGFKCHVKHRHDPNAEVFNCNYCSFATKLKRSLVLHFKNKHDDNATVFKCNLCDYVTKMKTNLVRHVKGKHDVSAYDLKCNDYLYFNKTGSERMNESDDMFRSSETIRMGDIAMAAVEEDSIVMIADSSGLSTKQMLQGNHCQDDTLIDPNDTSKHDSELKNNYESLFSKDITCENTNVRMYHCERCDHKTKRRWDFIKHWFRKHDHRSKFNIKHNDLEVFECEFSGFATELNSNLTKHIKYKQDPEAKVYKCNYCTTELKRNLPKHLQVEHDDNAAVFTCNLCDYTTKEKLNLYNHIKHRHDENADVFRCNCCSFSTKLKTTLIAHLRHNHGNSATVFMCDYCSFRTKVRGALTRHTNRKHHDLSGCVLKCNDIGDSNKIDLKGMKRESNKEFCAATEIRMEEIESVNVQALHSPDLSPRQVLQANETLFSSEDKCKLQHYQDDFPMHTLNQLESKDCPSPLSKDETREYASSKMYYCVRCDHKTKYRLSLIRHWYRKHDRRSKLFMKFNTVDRGKIFKCRYCSFASKLNGNLTKHIKYKHDPNAEVFRCNACSYATKIKSGLTKHVKLKHDDDATVFACAHCDYMTKDDCHFRTHVKYKHDYNAEVFKCNHCSFVTKVRSSLIRHCKVKHDPSANVSECNYYNHSNENELEKANEPSNNTIQRMEMGNIDSAEIRGASLMATVDFSEFHSLPADKYQEPLSLDNDRHRNALKDVQELQKEKYLFQSQVLRERACDDTQMYYCEHCKYKTKHRSYFTRHCEIKHKRTVTFNNHGDSDKLFKCKSCSYATKLNTNLTKHIKYKHDENVEVFKCNDCSFTTKVKSNLRTHIERKRDDSSKVLKCDRCCYRTKFEKALSKHIKRKHGHFDDTLKYKDRDYSNNGELIEIRQQSGNNVCLPPTIDTKSIETLESVNFPEVQQDLQQNNCQDLPLLVRDKRKLQHIQDKISDYPSNTLKYEEEFQENVKFTGQLVPSKEAAPKEIDFAMYHCGHCDYKTKRRRVFMMHWKRKHDYRGEFNSKRDDIDKGRVFKCNFCSFASKLNTNITKHIKYKHDPNAEVFKCNMCNFATKKSGNFIRHVKLKHDEMFKWNYCNSVERIKFETSKLETIDVIPTQGNVETQHINNADIQDRSLGQKADFSEFPVHDDLQEDERQLLTQVSGNTEDINSDDNQNQSLGLLVNDSELSNRQELQGNKSQTLTETFVKIEDTAAVDNRCKSLLMVNNSKLSDQQGLQRDKCQMFTQASVYTDTVTVIELSNQHELQKDKQGQEESLVPSFRSEKMSSGQTDVEYHHCDRCNYKTRYRNTLFRHWKAKHKLRAKFNAESDQSENGKRFKCKFCSFATKLNSGLTKHIRYKHDANAEVFRCDHCSFTTKIKSNLSPHVRRKHSDSVRTLRCNSCTFSTIFESMLIKHAELRHNVTSNAVEYSDYDSFNRDDLENIKQESENEFCSQAMIDIIKNHSIVENVHISELQTQPEVDKYQISTQAIDDKEDIDTVDIKAHSLVAMANTSDLSFQRNECQELARSVKDEEKLQGIQDQMFIHSTDQLETSLEQDPEEDSSIRESVITDTVNKQGHSFVVTVKNSELSNQHESKKDKQDEGACLVPSFLSEKMFCDQPGVKTHRCDHCNYETRFRCALLRHWKAKHDLRAKTKRNDCGNAKVYKCKFCNFASKLNTNLTKHIKYKHDPDAEVFRCNHCSFATKIKSYHTKHVKEKHDVDAAEFACDRCNYKTKDKFSYKCHVKRMLDNDGRCNDNGKIFKCNFSNFATKLNTGLTKHIRYNHDADAEVFRCNHCSFATKTKAHLSRHVRCKHPDSARMLRCDRCSYTTVFQSLLVKHVERKHCCNAAEYNDCDSSNNKEMNEIKQESEDALYPPRIIKTEDTDRFEIRDQSLDENVNFSELQIQQDFQDQLVIHSTNTLKLKQELQEDQELIDVSLESKETDLAMYHCGQCDHKTKHRTTLIRHWKSKHDYSGEFNTECDNVDKVFKCTYCSFATKLNTNLTKHVRYKHDANAELFRCSYCTFATKIKSNLKMHVKRKHSDNVETFKCNSCSYTTTSASTLIKHVEWKHNDSADVVIHDECGFANKNDSEKINQELANEFCSQAFIKTEETARFNNQIHSVVENMMNFKGLLIQPELPGDEFQISTQAIDDKEDIDTEAHSLIAMLSNSDLSFQQNLVKDEEKHQDIQGQMSIQSTNYLKSTVKQNLQEESYTQECFNIDDTLNNQGHELSNEHALQKDKQGQEESPLPFMFKEIICDQTGVKNHHCNRCNYKTRYRSTLFRHWRAKHDSRTKLSAKCNQSENVKKFKCKFCSFASKLNTNLTKHIKYKHDPNAEVFKCNYCSFATKIKSYFTKHVKDKHDEGIKHNGRDSRGRTQFETSKQQSTDIFSIQANANPKQTDTDDIQGQSLIANMNCFESLVQEELQEASCQISTQESVNIDDTDAVNNQGHSFVMAENSEVPNQEESQKETLLVASFPPEEMICYKTGVEYHHCNRCNYKTRYKSALFRHWKAMHDLRAKVNAECDQFENSKRFKCKFCSFASKLNTNLTKHIKYKHDPDAEVLKCNHCGFATKIKSYFTRHVKDKHDGVFKAKDRDSSNGIQFHTSKQDATNIFSTQANVDAIITDTVDSRGHSLVGNMEVLELPVQQELHEDSCQIPLQECVDMNNTDTVNNQGHSFVSMAKNSELSSEEGSQTEKRRLSPLVDKNHPRHIQVHTSSHSTDTSEDVSESQAQGELPTSSLLSKGVVYGNTSLKMYHCEHCHYQTRYRSSFVRHWKAKHDSRPKVSTECDRFENGKRFKCKFCSFASKLNTNLTKHIKYKHDPNAEVFKCNYCNFATKFKSYLTKHVKDKHVGASRWNGIQF